MRASTAEAALEAGARIVNDVSGGQADPAMPSLIAETGAPYIVMHWRGHSSAMQSRAVYGDVVDDVARELRARVDALVARLADVARTDPLTGLRNRRAYDEILGIELARADRTGQPLSLIIGDVDHFKGVNDRLGHPTGDDVLRRVAALLEQSGRRVGVAVRLGGEEFALLLPATDAGGANRVAQRVGENLRRAFHRDPVPVTMSFGIASYPLHATDAGSLFEAADAALLAAKAQGRDRAVTWGHGTGPRPSPVEGPEGAELPTEVGGAEHLGPGGELRRPSVEDGPTLR
jgi:diguanylate cyclase (GGDEF)-like protein